ncbi:unnamed protein product [Coregonus sp. 'balchen']|nr:unnamed protein product [Coregonus sp. 'balchen']
MRMFTTTFPYHMSEEDMVSFAEGIQSCVAETGASEALARMIVAKGGIILVPSTQPFIYQGFSDKQHVVTLLPTETCCCSDSDSTQRTPSAIFLDPTGSPNAESLLVPLMQRAYWFP